MTSTAESRQAMQHATAQRRFDVESARAAFPILSESIGDKPLIYLDNAATTQKPKTVIDTVSHYYAMDNANIHRGVHRLSMRATDAFEAARRKVQQFVNAPSPQEVVFVRGATEAINLVAQCYARPRLQPGDEVLVTTMEHHSNIVPWQIVCGQTGAVLRVAPIGDDGALEMDRLKEMLSPKVKMVAVVHVSNALGTVNPVAEITRAAHEHGAAVLVDGAQSVPHVPVDVQAIGCDFFVFSGHKVYGPTGIGAIYGRRELLDAMPPYQGGGDMIASVTFEKTTYNELPYKFEAGTPNIAGAIGLGAALDFVGTLGLDAVSAYEAELLEYATQRLSAIPQLRVIGNAPEKASVLSFTLEGVHPHDVGTILDREGVAIRAGHHCAQPVMDRFGVPATARASFAFYNTKTEIDTLARGIERVIEVFH